MSVIIDGQVVFDGEHLKIEPGSFKRDSVQRSVSGLDGILSIDMGERGRTVKQQGVLRARSATQLTAQVNAISALMDGKTHTLTTRSGQQFDNLRMDAFKVKPYRTSGSGVEADYEISYTQLNTPPAYKGSY
jgi:hypothetical protein